MAGRKLILKSQVNASTVLEVVVSMVIIVLVFGTAMMIYGNVMRMSLPAQKLRAQAVLAQTMKAIQEAAATQDAKSLIAGFTVERTVKPYDGNAKLLEVDLKAYDENNQLLAELNQLILASDAQ